MTHKTREAIDQQQKQMMKTGIEIITEERQRHFNVEGWTAEHDDGHIDGELAGLAMCYLTDPEKREEEFGELEPPVWFPESWDLQWWKPTPDDRIRELAKAGALVVAEIDRLLRLNQQ